MDGYESQTDLGKRYGVTSHVIGRWLAKELGLRVVGGDPTAKAHELGLAMAIPTGRGDGEHTYWVWSVEETTRLLEEVGHKQISQLMFESAY